MELVPTLLALGGSVLWIAINQAAVREMRRRLGSDVREIRLFRRWAGIAQYAFVGLSLGFPLLAVLAWSKQPDRVVADLFPELMRSFWAISMAFAVGRTGRLLVGSRGLALGKDQFYAWPAVESIVWDRDIGQRTWGVAITVRPEKTPRKLRLYVRRELKPEVEQTLARHHDRLPAATTRVEVAGASVSP